jgi:hypothetical protein
MHRVWDSGIIQRAGGTEDFWLADLAELDTRENRAAWIWSKKEGSPAPAGPYFAEDTRGVGRARVLRRANPIRGRSRSGICGTCCLESFPNSLS